MNLSLPSHWCRIMKLHDEVCYTNSFFIQMDWSKLLHKEKMRRTISRWKKDNRYCKSMLGIHWKCALLWIVIYVLRMNFDRTFQLLNIQSNSVDCLISIPHLNTDFFRLPITLMLVDSKNIHSNEQLSWNGETIAFHRITSFCTNVRNQK